MICFKFAPDNLFIVLYKLKFRASTYNTFRDITFTKLQNTNLKRAITEEESNDFFSNFLQIIYSYFYQLTQVGFKSSAFILFEILHLQNCDVKFQNFKGQ